jgi:hypothetical protein
MRFRIAFLLFVSIIQFSNSLQGQEREAINVEFHNEPFQSFVQKAEQLYSIHIFYDTMAFENYSVTVVASKLSLPQLLERVFNKTSFHYAIDEYGHVFINTKAIHTNFPNNFFNNKNSVDSVGPEASFLSDDPSEKQTAVVSEENKLFEIGAKNINARTGNATIAGYIRDEINGEPIAGATVYLDTPAARANTDQFGYYSLTLSKGRHVLKIHSLGMQNTSRQILLKGDGKLDVELTDYVASLKAVIVTAEKRSNTQGLQMGTIKLNTKLIKQVPVAFGETDILKVVLTLPGVTSVGEASSGYNVRGGSTDENLILFSDATIYNPSHLFGFFSAFNSDVVKGVELYKSAIPEKFGGRLSSVLDVTGKDGNSKEWSGNAGIGPLTSEFAIDGPLVKNKTSIVIGGRTTYADWLLRDLPDAYNKSTASFYDLNLHISHTINANNSIYLTGYMSNDNFNLNRDTAYQYSNKNANIKWKHIFNNKFYAVTTTGVDNYEYAISSTYIPVDGYKLGFNINQKFLRADFTYTPNYKQTFDFGVSSNYYQLQSGSYSPEGKQSLAAPVTIPKEQALETAAYFGDQINLSSKLSVNAGLRWVVYNYLGPHDVYDYAPNQPRTVYTIIDTTSYGPYKVIKTYQAPEIRLSLRYALSDNQSLKLSYNTLNQYIHMISNTIAIAPTDIWKLSDTYIKPQHGDQISIGWYRNFLSNTIETSVEVYYKRLENYLDYKSGAEIVLNPHIETEVINTVGKAYGIEFLVKKTAGKLNGWLSYTYSRTFLKQDDPLAGETINNGNYYPASFDKPNNLNLIGNYRFSHRYSISSNIVYSTGRPITLPVDEFNINGSTSLYYSARNEYRIPNYFRTDLSVNIEGNHRIKQRFHNSWSAGVYNLTARQNAYSVYFTDVNGKIQGYQLSIFGTAIPYITYHIKF